MRSKDDDLLQPAEVLRVLRTGVLKGIFGWVVEKMMESWKFHGRFHDDDDDDDDDDDE